MTLVELFNLRETLETRINQYWSYWSIVIFAVSGWLYSGSDTNLEPIDALFISFALIVFFIANISVLYSATKFSKAIHDEICYKADDENTSISKDFRKRLPQGCIKFRLELTVLMHLLVDISIIGLLLYKAGIWHF